METRRHVTNDVTLQQLADDIRGKARHPANIALSVHAMQRARARGITPADAVRVLQSGRFDGPVVINDAAREYRFRMAAPVRGVTIIIVAVIRMDTEGRIFVITASARGAP